MNTMGVSRVSGRARRRRQTCKSVHARQVDIEQHEFRRGARRQLQREFTVVGGMHPVSFRLQGVCKKCKEGWQIVYRDYVAFAVVRHVPSQIGVCFLKSAWSGAKNIQTRENTDGIASQSWVSKQPRRQAENSA